MYVCTCVRTYTCSKYSPSLQLWRPDTYSTLHWLPPPLPLSTHPPLRLLTSALLQQSSESPDLSLQLQHIAGGVLIDHSLHRQQKRTYVSNNMCACVMEYMGFA